MTEPPDPELERLVAIVRETREKGERESDRLKAERVDDFDQYYAETRRRRRPRSGREARP